MIVGRRMSHPRVLVSVCIDHGQTPGAALLMVRTGLTNGARFELDQRSFRSGETQGAIIRSITERIPCDATVLLPTWRLTHHVLRHSLVQGRALAPPSRMVSLHYRPDLRTIYLPCGEDELAEAADAYEIDDESDPSWTALETKAARDAQALWLLFLWSHCRPKQRRWLAAAWEAWRVIERARKRPF